MKTLKLIAAKVYDYTVSIIILGCPICFFIVIGRISSENLIWFLLPVISILIITLLHIILKIYEITGKYSEPFLNRCCMYRYILLFLLGIFMTLFFYTSFIALSSVNFFHFKNTSIYIYIFTFIACHATVVNATPQYINKLRVRKKTLKTYVDADANRIVILLSYFVLLLIKQNQLNNTMIGLGLLFYLAFDRLYISIISNLSFYKEEYEKIKKDHIIEVKKCNLDYKDKQNNLDI